ncbi:MAG: hypothetical protein V3R87_02585, partial [Dehalococcoidia bacterium]
RGGDCPIRGWDSVAGVVMLSGYSEIPRLGIKLKSMAGSTSKYQKDTSVQQPVEEVDDEGITAWQASN